MGDKINESEVVEDDGKQSPEIVSGLPRATSRISGLRRSPRPTEYAEGPRITERPLGLDKPGAEVKAGIFATQGRLETLMQPVIARYRLREMGLDDELGDNLFLDSATFQEVVAEKVKSREAIIGALHIYFRYINSWWDSENPVERLWGQLNNAFLIIPRWQFMEDLKAVLGDQVEATESAGYADENLVVVALNKEALKQRVYAKLVKGGFPDGEDNKIYTEAELSAIIATKPEKASAAGNYV